MAGRPADFVFELSFAVGVVDVLFDHEHLSVDLLQTLYFSEFYGLGRG